MSRAQGGAGDRQRQGGGFVLGLIVGLLGGLALALAVALYVTKVPIPFIDKVPQPTGDRDAVERERNRNWDPNSPLYGNNPARPGAPATANTAPAPAESVADPALTKPPPDAAPTVATTEPIPAPEPPRRAASASTAPIRSAAPAAPTGTAGTDSAARDPAAILSDRTPGTDPGDNSLSTKPRDDPFMYFVQAGAYGRPEEAEQQRARLAMVGIETRVTEREQGGRTVYRVRVGPFDRRDQADATKQRLEAAAVEAALVRVQK
jgi:cell division protein FtsN